MSVIEEVKQKIDIVDIVGQYTPLTKSGRNFRAVCPFHQEKTPSFFVFPERQSWHCFGACSAGGDVFSFVMKREGIEFGEALRRLADRAGVALPSRVEDDKGRDERDRLYKANEAASAYFHELLVTSPMGEHARDYLRTRGVNSTAIEEFKLGYAPDSWDSLKTELETHGFVEMELLEAGLLSKSEKRVFDRWRNRLMFPIKDERGHTTGFGARILATAEGPKYINTPQSPVFDKSGTLYGLNLAAAEIRKMDRAVIVEGYMDVIAAHQYGFKNVIASMGTSITEKQVNILKRLTRNVVLAMDSDPAGAEAMGRCVEHENTLESEIRVAVLPEGKDPDDVIKEDQGAWAKLVSEAEPVLDFVFESVRAGLNLDKVTDRSRARDRLYPVVDGIHDVVRKTHYVQKLASMLRINESSLGASIQKQSASASKRGMGRVQTEARVAEGIFKRPAEEFCLSLLLRFPELREEGTKLPTEYFENSENRELFLAWCEGDGSPQGINASVDDSIQDHLARVMGKEIRPLEIRNKYDNCVLRLREEHLRSLERKREALLAGDSNTSVELAKSKAVSTELRKVFELKGRREQGLRS